MYIVKEIDEKGNLNIAEEIMCEAEWFDSIEAASAEIELYLAELKLSYLDGDLNEFNEKLEWQLLRIVNCRTLECYKFTPFTGSENILFTRD
ncbi:MAG: hypothetical protein ABJN40_22955 [Sneathiella sp.]